MKILIVATNDFSEGTYKKFISIIEDIGHDFIAFIGLIENEFFNIQLGNMEYTMYPLTNIPQLEYDKILIASINPTVLINIYQQLLDLEVPREKISKIFWLIKQFMTQKYEDCNDKIVLETLNYWKTNDINPFNQHIKAKDSFSEVLFDKFCDLPYIMLESVTGKKYKLYYPPDGGGSFVELNGITYVANILREQLPGSPHLYMKGNHKINDGGRCGQKTGLRKG